MSNARPAVVDRAGFQAELDRLRAREEAHTREGDANRRRRYYASQVTEDCGEHSKTGVLGPRT